MFTPLQNLLPQEFNRRGMGKVIDAARVCQKFRELLPKIFPAEMKEFMDAHSFKNGILLISVTDGIWAKAVLDKKAEIIKLMNESIGQNLLRELRTKVENLTAKAKSLQ